MSYEWIEYKYKKEKRKIIFSMILINLIILLIICIPLINRPLKLIRASPDESYINFYETKELTKEEIKEQLEVLFGKPKYIYLEKTELSAMGYCNIFYRTIIIDKNLTPEAYTITLAHELTHLTYFTTSERFCNFNAWKVLYESDNLYFKNVANYYMIHDMYGFEYEEYSCWGNILEYLKGEK